MCMLSFFHSFSSMNDAVGWTTGMASRNLSLSGCLQLLELLEILQIWNLKFLLDILKISWNLIDVPGKILLLAM